MSTIDTTKPTLLDKTVDTVVGTTSTAITSYMAKQAQAEIDKAQKELLLMQQQGMITMEEYKIRQAKMEEDRIRLTGEIEGQRTMNLIIGIGVGGAVLVGIGLVAMKVMKG